MLIAIAADLHDNLANWHIFSNYLKKQGINTLLFCGDLTNEETLKQVRSDFKGEIFLIAGNQELYEAATAEYLPQTHLLGRYGVVDIAGLKIGLIHEPSYRDRLCQEEPNLNYLFYGHTHKPWLERNNNLFIANPGTLGGVFYKASFSILDTDTGRLELKILETI
jgi:putative phosphoesterase